jgi:hypothetical protein
LEQGFDEIWRCESKSWMANEFIPHRIFYFFHRPVFLGIETRHFGNWICFHSQVKEGGREKTPSQLGALEKANLNHKWLLYDSTYGLY